MRQTLRQLVAEFIGTFFLCFPGIAAIVAEAYRPGSVGGAFGIAAAHGIGLAIGVTTTLAVSGGHLNPAITIAFWSIGRIDARKAGLYVVAQLLAGIVAALAVKFLFPSMAGVVTQLGTPHLGTDITAPAGTAIEAIATFLLAFAMIGSCVDTRAHRLGGYTVGLTLFIAILAVGTMTGAALNPARAFGPALVSGTFTAQIVYWVGPIVGAIVAMQVYERLFIEKRSA
jgi:aquaporin Z